MSGIIEKVIFSGYKHRLIQYRGARSLSLIRQYISIGQYTVGV